MPRINGLNEIRLGKFSELKELPGVLETLFLYHYLHKSKANLKPKLAMELKQMLLDGTTRRLRAEAYKRLLEGR
jgi:uncharacterized protein YfbU (UPF0304 family)